MCTFAADASRLGEMTEQPTPDDLRVVVLSTDLMDRSKIEGAFPDATFVRSPAALTQEAVGADLVIVDLARLHDPGAIMSIEARVVAFGSHVDDRSLAAAEAAGAEAIPRSVFFKRIETGAV